LLCLILRRYPVTAWFYSGFNFTSSSSNNVDTYQKIVETFKFGYAAKTYLGDKWFDNVKPVRYLRCCNVGL